jgi:hypothetical protein
LLTSTSELSSVRIKASISSERRSRLVICGLDVRDWRAFSPIFSLGVVNTIALNICSTIFAIELERGGGFRLDPARGTNGVSFLELGMVNGVCMVWRSCLKRGLLRLWQATFCVMKSYDFTMVVLSRPFTRQFFSFPRAGVFRSYTVPVGS